MTNTSLRRISGLACVWLVVVYLTVGLWPFSFHPPNNVSRLPDRPGLHFQPQGIAYDTATLPKDFPGGSNHQSASFSFELWLEPELEPNTDAFYILAIDDGHPQSNLVFCQWQSEFIFRVRDSDHERGFREIGIIDALQKQQARLITITSDESGTTCYVDGKLARQFPGFVLAQDSLRGRMILGNCEVGRPTWSGKLFGLAMFNRKLDEAEAARHHAMWTNQQGGELASTPGLIGLYTFDGEGSQWVQDVSPNRHRLFIPPRYEVLQKRVLAITSEDFEFNYLAIRDLTINLLGFIPLGFFAFVYLQTNATRRRGTNVLIAIFAGATLSLLIELIQVWLPTRHSSMADLLLNIAGTSLGALFVTMFYRETKESVAVREMQTPALSP